MGMVVLRKFLSDGKGRRPPLNLYDYEELFFIENMFTLMLKCLVKVASMNCESAYCSPLSSINGTLPFLDLARIDSIT